MLCELKTIIFSATIICLYTINFYYFLIIQCNSHMSLAINLKIKHKIVDYGVESHENSVGFVHFEL